MLEISLIILLIFAVYFRTIYHYFIIDDYVAHSSLKDIDPKLKPKGIKLWWPLWTINQKLKYYPSQVIHFVIIVIHTLVCVMIYVAFGKTWESFLAVLLFAFNPFNSEVSIWVSGRMYGLTALMVLVAWTIPLLAPFIFAYASFLSIPIITTPLLFIFSGYKIIVLAFIVTVFLKLDIVLDPKSAKVSSYCYHKEAWAWKFRKLIIALKFYGYYFVQGIFAFKCVNFHKYNSQYLCDQEGTDKAYREIDIYLIIGILLLSVLISTRNFGLFWFTICIVPFCNFISAGNMLVAARYAYLANIGLMLMLAQIPYAWIFFLGWYLSKLPYVMKNYENDFWNNTFQIMEEPGYFHSWLIHGNMMFVRGHFGAAFQDYTEAKNLNPHNFKVYYNLSSVCCAFYDIPNAITALEEAKKWDLLGQEKTKENIVREREELIGSMFVAQQQGKPLELRIVDIPLMI